MIKSAAIGMRLSLYEQVYNDLTAAVARAKEACRKRKIQPPKIVAPNKNHRGRPKGSKDNVPRKIKAKVQTATVQSGGSDCVPESMACREMNQIFFCELNHSAPYEAAPCILPESEVEIFDMLRVCDTPAYSPKDPPCWELPIPY